MSFIDYYQVLQVHSEAEAEIIQSAYKRLCRKYHPDVNPSPSAAGMMQKLNEAYEVLGDERKRRLFHLEWMRRAARPAPASAPAPQVKVEVRERVVYVKNEPERFGGGTEQAYQAIMDYFKHLSKRQYREAFALVSELDKTNFTYGAFVEWQDSVSAVYEIGSVKLKLFKRRPNFKTGESGRFDAEEFAVTISEKVKNTGVVNEYTVNKYAVLEKGVWKVYLGYRDLTPLMLQFRSMVNQEEAQLVGVWDRYRENTDMAMGLSNKSGFLRQVEEEAYRYRRYRRSFSIVVFQVRLPARVGDLGHRERVVRYIGCIISQSIRPIDHLAFFGDDTFGLMLAETDRDSAMMAAKRILGAVRHDIAACFDFAVDIRSGLTEYDGRDTELLIQNCLDVISAGDSAKEKQA